jgi:hypothetical protein
MECGGDAPPSGLGMWAVSHLGFFDLTFRFLP